MICKIYMVDMLITPEGRTTSCRHYWTVYRVDGFQNRIFLEGEGKPKPRLIITEDLWQKWLNCYKG